MNNIYKLYTDGACWGNPGKTAAGLAIYDEEDNEVYKGAVFFGDGTNNTAEYSAIYEGLLAAKRIDIKDLEVFSDSELIIKQLNNEYKVKSAGLKIINRKIRGIAETFDTVSYNHLKREYTTVPHELAEKLLEKHSKDL